MVVLVEVLDSLVGKEELAPGPVIQQGLVCYVRATIFK